MNDQYMQQKIDEAKNLIAEGFELIIEDHVGYRFDSDELQNIILQVRYFLQSLVDSGKIHNFSLNSSGQHIFGWYEVFDAPEADLIKFNLDIEI